MQRRHYIQTTLKGSPHAGEVGVLPAISQINTKISKTLLKEIYYKIPKKILAYLRERIKKKRAENSLKRQILQRRCLLLVKFAPSFNKVVL
jgi:hypothetical protein